MPTLDVLLRHPLLVAAVQLLVGILIAYCFAERWQRWRQQRDFQYRAMVKFNELTHDLADRMAELLMSRAEIGSGTPAPSYWEKHRAFVTRWVALEGMRDELVAVFSEDTIREFDELRETLKTLRGFINTDQARTSAVFQPIQDRFLLERRITSVRMIRDMGFTSKKTAAAATRTLGTRKPERKVE